MERTLVLVKPDGVQRGLIGEIIGRFERRGLKIVGLRLLRVSRQLAETHYAVHAGKHFYAGLVDFITSGPVAAIVLEAPDAIAMVRAMVGRTMPAQADPGTIRGDLGVAGLRNLIHASDAPDTAASEIALWFGDAPPVDYRREIDRWVLEDAAPSSTATTTGNASDEGGKAGEGPVAPSSSA